MAEKKFHGRFEESNRSCEHPRCKNAGEFRAPGFPMSGFDGPGKYRWFCLEHIRDFNSAYDWFEGMSTEEIITAQSPSSGWKTESLSFSPTAGADTMPKWADFDDPLAAISARANNIKSKASSKSQTASNDRFTVVEVQALDVLGLGLDSDLKNLRRRYSDLVRRYHPDKNGGDRKFEHKLNDVVEAYQVLRKSRAFN